MGYGTIRISDEAHATLRALAGAEKKPMATLLDEAVEALRRQRFLEQVNAAYASLRSDAEAWRSVEAERRSWDVTLSDGLAVAERRGQYGARPGTKRRPARRNE